jgi:saccharopine dehydrogenase-like NADP-dependent oxidoreductase
MDNRILIVGGYGAVGRIVAARLANRFPGQVIAAGRNYDKANALAQESGEKIRPLQLDIFTAHETPDILNGVSLVVMCLDLPDTRFVELCLQKGIDYVDITANYDFLAQVEALDGMSQANGGTAVLSVGLAPGLTNLLARHAQSQFDELRQVDIHLLLGLGEAHGEAAVRWTVENFNTEFTVQEAGTARRVKSFEDGKQTTFPGSLGKRTTYRFNFSDQHVLPRTLNVGSVSTRLSFDSALVTNLLALLKKSGLFAILRYQWAQDGLVKLLSMFQFGSDQFVVQVDVQGIVDGQPRAAAYAVSGNNEGRMTGLAAAQAVERLVTADFPPGVFHIEQLFEPLLFIESLRDDDLRYHVVDNWKKETV